MAPRPTWKGYLKLSLVTCAVELSNATTESEKVRFKTLNRATGNTVRRQYIDGVTGKPVDKEDEVKGYETDEGEFLLIEEEEIDEVQIESSHTLSLDSFVSKDEIDPIYLDTPYYLTPADKVSEEAFAAIRDAMATKNMAGLARIVLFRRERPVVIEPHGRGMLLTTLRYDNTVRQPDEIFDGIKDVEIEKDIIDLATHIIDNKTTTFRPDTFEDKYENALIELINAKKSGHKPKPAKAEEPRSNVVNLFDALKKSLAADEDKPAKQPAEKPAGKTAKKPASSSAKKRTSA